MEPLAKCSFIAVAALAPLARSAQDALPEPTVHEVIERTIAPASANLWSGTDPQTDAEWDGMENAITPLPSP